MTHRSLPLLLALALLVTGCSFGGRAGTPVPVTPPLTDAPRAATPIGKYIKHVVILIQENRTFDNLFDGYPHADTVTQGRNSVGAMVTMQPVSFLAAGQDMIHNFRNAVTAWDNGNMDRFDLTPFDNGMANGSFAYSYVERDQVVPYWELAHQYVLADRMFPMEFGPSFTSHLALIAGTDNLAPGLAEANYPFAQPWGCDARFSGATTTTVNSNRVLSYDGPLPCFTQFRTMADVLDEAHVSWRYYAPPIASEDGGQLWSSFDAIAKVRYGPDWAKVVSPETRVIDDARHGRLAAVTWVVPDWQNSDHPAASSDTGPSWVTSVVNAIGEGPDWKSTAIFIIWDDWGGWYDDAAPPQPDFRGLGIRVPLLIVSPYARKDVVDHDTYETGSLLRFAELAFGLNTIGPASKGYTDARAAAPLSAFDFKQKPRKFRPIRAKYSTWFFEHHTPSLHPVDEE